jgi:N-acetylglucosaminyldiphosphoundecaprenol N-acetyl-beta-D-mannosaminyltransferase
MPGDEQVKAAVQMNICGNVIQHSSADEVLAGIEARLRSSTGPGLVICTVNLDHVYHSRAIGAVRKDSLEWLLVADGMPIAWRGHLLTSESWPRVTGADLLPRILRMTEEGGGRVGFLGGRLDTHQRLSERLARLYPALGVSGMWSPDADYIEKNSAALAAEIRAVKTDVLVVSLGKPRQEQWVGRYGAATGVRIFTPFGCAIEFLAGTKRRAPMWVQRIGMEWCYRLSQEPRRLARRYLIQGPVSLLRAFRADLVISTDASDAGIGTTRYRDHAKDRSVVRDSPIIATVEARGE